MKNSTKLVILLSLAGVLLLIALSDCSHRAEIKNNLKQEVYVDAGKKLFDSLRAYSPYEVKHLGFVNKKTGALTVVSIESDNSYSFFEAEIVLELSADVADGVYYQTGMYGDEGHMTLVISKTARINMPVERIGLKSGEKELHQFVSKHYRGQMCIYIGTIEPPAAG